MSRTRNYNLDTLDTQNRFFDALDALAQLEKLNGGISGFCELHGIDKRHLYTQKREPNRGYFEVGWLVPLVKFYKVSSNWLLTGRGKMLRESSKGSD